MIITIRTLPLPFLLAAALQIVARNADAATIYVNAKAKPSAWQDGVSSLPGSVLSIPARTVANTTLFANSSTFEENSAGGNGGAIYLAASTATIKANEYEENHAALGRSIYGVGSIINGRTTSPFMK